MDPKKQEIINNTINFIKEKFSGETTGHDWFHIKRVYKVATLLAEKENADIFTVQLAALLHDIADWKFHEGNDDIGPQKAREWLEKNQVDEATITHICKIIKSMSFKGAHVKSEMITKEGMCVQDADRLDAIGAIGIARCFAYSGSNNIPIYNPEIQPELHTSFEDYKTKQNSAINHFHEKLLLLKERMNTNTAKELAKQRHEFIEVFLKEFLEEWEGKK